jgi:hypothetical protein
MKHLILAITAAVVAIGMTALVAFAAPSAPKGGDRAALVAFAGPSASKSGDPVWTAITQARAATAKYHDVRQARKDGYVAVSPCVEAPDGSGAMGIHYLNGAYVDDPAIKAGKPELLLYFPEPNGKLRLVGVEYFRPDADQDLTTTDDRPNLAGVEFDGPMEGHDPGMPRHYDLHAWVWTWNPSGIFAQFNPNLRCP